MSWTDGVCDEHESEFVDGECPDCPTEAELIEKRNFYGVACRVLDKHEYGGWATKASFLGEAMQRCFEAGKVSNKEPIKTESTLLKYELTSRGFVIAEFKDRYDDECSIQESSLATEACIWLGQSACKKCDSPVRMHLTQEHAKELITALQYFVETGELPRPETKNDS